MRDKEPGVITVVLGSRSAWYPVSVVRQGRVITVCRW